LETSPKARAERISKRDEMSKAKALKHVNERDMHNRGRYMALYGVDIYDHSNFDVIINTEKYSVGRIADIVVAAYRAKEKR
jgi:cytidylate kinase